MTGADDEFIPGHNCRGLRLAVHSIAEADPLPGPASLQEAAEVATRSARLRLSHKDRLHPEWRELHSRA
jgi:hypothetical protein